MKPLRDPSKDVMRLLRDYRSMLDGCDGSPDAVFFADNTLDHGHGEDPDGKAIAMVCWPDSLEIIQLGREDDGSPRKCEFDERGLPKPILYNKIVRLTVYKAGGIDALKHAVEYMSRIKTMIGDHDAETAEAAANDAALT